MKTDKILKTDLLDILFENKNKEYGAYELRKNYVNRVKKSLLYTACLVLVFAGLQSWKTPKKNVKFEFGPLTEFTIEPYKNIDVEKPKVKEEKFNQKNNVAQVINTTPVIVTKAKIDDLPKPNEVIDTSAISSNANTSNGSGTGSLSSINNSGGNGIGGTNSGGGGNTDTGDDEPIWSPSVMPEFIGGVDALKEYMIRNLHQPDDLERGERITIVAKFVVDKNGNINDIEIVQSGRNDLDAEVMRVINKMPAWKPGLQNGFAIAAYFKMPVTFVNND